MDRFVDFEGNPVKYQQLTQNRPHAHRMSFAPSGSLEEEQQNKTLRFHAVPFTKVVDWKPLRTPSILRAIKVWKFLAAP
jgi:hypothetical protein